MERVFVKNICPTPWLWVLCKPSPLRLETGWQRCYTVEIEGLGFFSTTLKCTHPVMNKKEVRAESVKMSTVKFRPGIEFKRYVAGKMELNVRINAFFPINRKQWATWLPVKKKHDGLSGS